MSGELVNCRVWLYYTKIGIGTPPKEYHVQVDTGSDIMWINCIQCQGCVNKGYHGLDLTQYDPNASYTEKPVTCQEEICKDINGVTDTVHGCKANASCFYNENYGDGSNSMGYMVKDVVQYDSVFGDLITRLEKASVIFGCGTIQTGTINSSDDALDGILGFGNSNASVISQLASSGKVKKMFAHCLDSENGGGIFAIGHVVQPKVNSTHLIQEQGHYTVNVTGIEVDAEFLNLSTYAQHGGVEKRRAIIDSGTTLAYLPEVIYKPLVNKIITGRLDMRHLYPHDGYTCMDLSGSLDGEFPAVTFHFESSLSLKVYPHDYLFAYVSILCLANPLDLDRLYLVLLTALMMHLLLHSSIYVSGCYGQWRSLNFSAGGAKTYIPKNFYRTGGAENVYTHKFLYENYIYNTTERKIRGGGRPSPPLLSFTLGYGMF
ncbi:putative nepenthesin [Helianthus anomalus]